jgi:small GTP-binding protein
MPVNAGGEYFAAERKYLDAKTREEKIAALEEMIKTAPKHKGSEHLLSELRHRLAKLKKEGSSKTSSKPKFVIRKEGAAQVCVIGSTKSGKSTLINSLTNAKVEVADYPYTTKTPEVGMMKFGDVQIQMIEIPSTFDPESLSLLHSCDEIVIVLDGGKDLLEQEKEMEKIIGENRLGSKRLVVVVNKADAFPVPSHRLSISAKENVGIDKLKERIWSNLSMIRVYTKSPGKYKDLPALALKSGSKVADVAKSLHKDFVKNFKYARVFNGTKFSGQKVGLDYELKDMDVIEIHLE